MRGFRFRACSLVVFLPLLFLGLPERRVACAEEPDQPAPLNEGARTVEEPQSSEAIGSIEFPPAILKHPRVDYFIKLFSGRGRASFEKALQRSGRYKETMNGIFRAQGLPHELLYLCVIESGFSPLAVSETRTTGLWQFTFGTGRKYGLKIDSWLDERKDPIKSTQAAASYLKDLHGQFGEWLWSVAAYNTGNEGLKRALKKISAASTSPLDAKVPLKPLTRDFVAKFVATALIAREPDRYGFHNVAYDAHLNYDEVQLTKPLSLETIAGRTSTTVDAIMNLNPALLRNATPPQDTPFLLRLPVGRGGIFSGFPFALPEIPKIRLLKNKAEDEETERPTAELQAAGDES